MTDILPEADSPVKVNFNVDVNALLKGIFGRSKNNDLMVIVKNGTTRDASVDFAIDPGGHGDLASVQGSPNISPVDPMAAAATATYCAIGVHAVGAGSNIYLAIPIGGRVIHAICATPVNKENYVKHTVTNSEHTVSPMRDRLDGTPKHYANGGVTKVTIGNITAWITITATSKPAICNIELREKTGAISYV